MIGEAAVPTFENIRVALSDAGLQKVEEVLFSTFAYEIPLDKDELKTFQSTINFLSANSRSAPTGVSTSLIKSDTVPVPILVRQLGVYCFGEPETFTTIGLACDAPEQTRVDAPVNVAGIPNPCDSTQVPATLEVGGPVFRFYDWFAHSYRLEFVMGRLTLFSQLVADCATLAQTDYIGFGCSQIPTQYYVHRLNNRLRDIKASDRFIPINQTIKSDSENSVTALGAPANTASVAYGAGSNPGIAGKMYTVKRPFVIMPNQAIQAQLVQLNNDDMFTQRMIADLGDPGVVTIGDEYTEFTEDNGVDKVCGAGKDEPQTIYSASRLFQWGQFKVGLAIRGFELTPRAIMTFFEAYGSLFPTEMYADVQLPQGVIAGSKGGE